MKARGNAMSEQERIIATGISASTLGENLLQKVNSIKKLRKELNMNIWDYEFIEEEMQEETIPFDEALPTSSIDYADTPVQYDSNILELVYNHELISGRNISLEQLNDVFMGTYTEFPYALSRKKLPLPAGVVYRDSKGNIPVGLNSIFAAYEYTESHQKPTQSEFISLDGTEDLLDDALAYNHMIRQRAAAYYHIINLAKKNTTLTEAVLGSMFLSTLPDELSKNACYKFYYRQWDMNCFLDNLQENDTFAHSKAINVENNLENTINNYNNEIRCVDEDRFIIAVTKLFLDICRIAPFDEGRYPYTACLVLNLELMKAGYHGISLRANELDEIKKRTTKYYSDRNPEPMAYLIALYIENTLLNLIDEAQNG